jgi:ABC-type sugar transport system ATPase subunit
VFQSYALYPHMSVMDNLAFALRIRRLPEPEVKVRVAEVARALGIDAYLARRPKQLSGGQRQRVAIGRALIRNPKVFLFDEPLSNLDAKLRSEMRREIARIHQRSRTTALYVTHDQIEAMTLADRIIVLRDGRVQQVGSPSEIYDRPANRFVAGFFGTPAMNFLSGHDAGLAEDRDVVVGIRPEAITLDQRPDATPLRASVDIREVLGAEVLLHLRSDAGELTVRTVAGGEAREGDNVTVWLDRERLHMFDARSEQRL